MYIHPMFLNLNTRLPNRAINDMFRKTPQIVKPLYNMDVAWIQKLTRYTCILWRYVPELKDHVLYFLFCCLLSELLDRMIMATKKVKVTERWRSYLRSWEKMQPLIKFIINVYLMHTLVIRIILPISWNMFGANPEKGTKQQNTCLICDSWETKDWWNS